MKLQTGFWKYLRSCYQSSVSTVRWSFGMFYFKKLTHLLCAYNLSCICLRKHPASSYGSFKILIIFSYLHVDSITMNMVYLGGNVNFSERLFCLATKKCECLLNCAFIFHRTCWMRVIDGCMLEALQKAIYYP